MSVAVRVRPSAPTCAVASQATDLIDTFIMTSITVDLPETVFSALRLVPDEGSTFICQIPMLRAINSSLSDSQKRARCKVS